MFVAESSRRSNLRVLYGILAQSALEQFNARTEETHRDVYFQNFVRLLEMYRHKSLRRPSPRAVLDRRASSVQELRRKKKEADAIDDALEHARQTVYGELSREQLVDHLKTLFSDVMKDRPVARGDVRLAKRFLEVFAESLRT